jgi:hypothetical protein
MAKLRYRAAVLNELIRHGVKPTSDTPIEIVRQFVNDLYLYEIRRLRSEMRAGLIPKSGYAARVTTLRKSYPVLSVPPHHWTEPGP